MSDILANIPGIDVSEEVPAKDKTKLWITLASCLVVIVLALVIWEK